jgi:heavy metal sensor kinase
MKPLPLRAHIALLSTIISGGVLLAFGGAGWYLLYQERVAALDREIRGLAYRHPGWMGGRVAYERLASAIEFVFGEDRNDQMILLVTDVHGVVRYRSPHWPAALDPGVFDLQLSDNPAPDRAESPGPASPRRGPPWASGTTGRGRGGGMPSVTFSKVPRFQTIRTGDRTWRVGVLGNEEDRLVLGLDCADLETELGRIRGAFLVALPLALLAIGGGGWWIAGRSVRPLRTIAQVAEKVTARGLDQRVPVSDEDPEIARLIGVLNGMMDRLEASFTQATRFSADASHELKTPLAVMQGELEQALHAAIPGSNEQRAFANLLEETQRLKGIIRSLLLLAQADAGQLPLALHPVDLSAALVELGEDAEVLAGEAGIRFELAVPQGIRVEADWPLLRQAVLNLLQNAVRYNEPQGWIRLAAETRETNVELQFCNGGPGVPERDQPRLFDRFFRSDAARSRAVDGAGLGLSLAREIVRAHGGTLLLTGSRPGRTCFLLSLPSVQVARPGSARQTEVVHQD